MDERELWKLFYDTGLPSAYTALAGIREERLAQQAELARADVPPEIQRS